MSRITMRGGTTMTISGIYDDTTTNPNEPLFILDGFESSLQEINDLDINRIESITLLLKMLLPLPFTVQREQTAWWL